MYKRARRRAAGLGIEERPKATRLLLLLLWRRNTTEIAKVNVHGPRKGEVGGYDSEVFFGAASAIGFVSFHPSKKTEVI